MALELLNRGISVQLNVAGPDWKGINDELKKIYADSVHKENIVFHGSVTEDKKIDLFSQANIFVSASEYEGFGISAIEALASGTYVVLNNIPSFRTFINDPSYGMITDFSDIQKTADIIAKKLTEVDFNTVETVARNYAFQFSWEIVERKIYDFYKSVLN